MKGAALEAAAVKTVVLTNLERGKVHNGTVLRFADGNQTLPPAPPDLIQNAVRTAPGWSEAVPHLAETTEEGREWVLGFIRGLRATGIAAVRCGDLTAALAGRVRADWAARHADPASERAWEGDEEFGAVVRMVWPDESADSRERWERLKRAIPDRIASLDRQERVRERLAVVFTALARAIEESGHAPPTQAELTERTGIARATLSDDFRLLKELISELGIQNPDS